MNYYLNISEIASYIGISEYDPVSSFERLWKRYDQHTYNKLLDHLSITIRETEQKADKLKLEITTQKQQGLNTHKLEKELEKQNDTKINLEEQIDKNMKKVDKIEKYLGSDVLNNLNQVQDINVKKDLIQTAINSTTTLNEKQKNHLLNESESFINTDHGIKQEESAIEMFEKKFKIKLDVSQKYYSKMFLPHWYVGGKVDGLYNNQDQSFIVEIKNRTRGFFNGLRDYEKVQVQLYMWILNINMTKLVERYNSKLRITKIYKDEEYIQFILAKLHCFVEKFSEFLNYSYDEKLKYIKLDNSGKKKYILRLYITLIHKMDLQDDNTSEIDECIISSN